MQETRITRKIEKLSKNSVSKVKKGSLKPKRAQIVQVHKPSTVLIPKSLYLTNAVRIVSVMIFPIIFSHSNYVGSVLHPEREQSQFRFLFTQLFQIYHERWNSQESK